MGNAIGEHQPSPLRRAFAGARPSDVHDVVVAESPGIAIAKDLDGDSSRLAAQDPAAPSRRIFRAAQREKQHRAEHDPCDVQRPEGPAGARHGSYNNDPMTRAEIEQTLLEIVQKEKQMPAASLASDAPLADAGIDSLDALTILFAIEEHFKITIPDDRARAMKTFGDMVDTVEALVAERA